MWLPLCLLAPTSRATVTWSVRQQHTFILCHLASPTRVSRHKHPQTPPNPKDINAIAQGCIPSDCSAWYLMLRAPTMHCSSFTQQQGSLLRPVTRTKPFRPVTASKGKSRRTLHRRLVSANGLEDLAQDLVQVVQASPLVSGAVATTGKTPCVSLVGQHAC